MPETMSPREKVARIIDPAAFLFTADELMKGDPSQFNALAKADQIFAALASSGDHAELARLADEAADFGVPAKVDPAVLNALIAEVAALRAQSDFYKRDNDVLMKNAWVSRATEAERKLDEAVGLLANMVRWADDPSDDACGMAREIEWAEASRTFLSKEAERG